MNSLPSVLKDGTIIQLIANGLILFVLVWLALSFRRLLRTVPAFMRRMMRAGWWLIYVLREFGARDKSIPVSVYIWDTLKSKVAAFIKDQKRKPVYFSELASGWPPIWRYEQSGDYLIKAQHKDAVRTANRSPQKAVCYTGFGLFVLSALGAHGTGGDKIIVGSVMGLAGAAISWPFWSWHFQSGLKFRLSRGEVWWKNGGRYRRFPAVYKIELRAPHPMAEEERRVHEENLRRGAIHPTTKFTPVYRYASQLVLRYGYQDREWEILADLADDEDGRLWGYPLQTALDFLHKKSLAEAIEPEIDRQQPASRVERFR